MAKYETSKTDVRREFQHVRMCMRQLEQMMKDGITDYSNDGDANQTILEAMASLSTMELFILERRGE